MKVREINIEKYRHLENLAFDFTYPEGHPRAGEPLDKICFIGQSATGKTSMLDLIKSGVDTVQNVETVNHSSIWGKSQWLAKGRIQFESALGPVLIADNRISALGVIYRNNQEPGGSIHKLPIGDANLAYISADLLSKQSLTLFAQNPVTITGTDHATDITRNLTSKAIQTAYLYVLSQETETDKWILFLSKILDYRKRFLQMASELLNKGSIGDLTRLNKQVSLWKENNNDPLEPFADFFNPILKKLGLEIDLINTEYPVPIKPLNSDTVIPISDLSTGTKTLLLSMFPLFELDTGGAILLLDEPERSLFPDIQVELMSHYRRCAPGAQIIVATHSPFIAAAFEPEERFILYFNEGKVCVRRGHSPIGDDPNDILKNDFQIDYYNAYGHDAYSRYLKLKQDVHAETDPAKKRELVVELAQLGDQYNF